MKPMAGAGVGEEGISFTRGLLVCHVCAGSFTFTRGLQSQKEVGFLFIHETHRRLQTPGLKEVL